MTNTISGAAESAMPWTNGEYVLRLVGECVYQASRRFAAEAVFFYVPTWMEEGRNRKKRKSKRRRKEEKKKEKRMLHCS